MDSNSKQLVALVSGANKGIGYYTVKHLLSKGYLVYLGVRVLKLDIGSDESIKAAVEQIGKETDHLDVLVNNAAINIDTAGTLDVEIKKIRDTFDVNLYGTITLTQKLIPLLRAGTNKHIVNVSSGLASLALSSYPEFAFYSAKYFAYTASKAALNMFTVKLASELQAESFRVNAINPGFTRTDMNQNTGTKDPDAVGKFIAEFAAQPTGASSIHIDEQNGIVPW